MRPISRFIFLIFSVGKWTWLEVGAVGKAVRVCRQGRQLSLVPCGEGTETQNRDRNHCKYLILLSDVYIKSVVTESPLKLLNI